MYSIFSNNFKQSEKKSGKFTKVVIYFKKSLRWPKVFCSNKSKDETPFKFFWVKFWKRFEQKRSFFRIFFCVEKVSRSTTCHITEIMKYFSGDNQYFGLKFVILKHDCFRQFLANISFGFFKNIPENRIWMENHATRDETLPTVCMLNTWSLQEKLEHSAPLDLFVMENDHVFV